MAVLRERDPLLIACYCVLTFSSCWIRPLCPDIIKYLGVVLYSRRALQLIIISALFAFINLLLCSSVIKRYSHITDFFSIRFRFSSDITLCQLISYCGDQRLHIQHPDFNLCHSETGCEGSIQGVDLWKLVWRSETAPSACSQSSRMQISPCRAAFCIICIDCVTSGARSLVSPQTRPCFWIKVPWRLDFMLYGLEWTCRAQRPTRCVRCYRNWEESSRSTWLTGKRESTSRQLILVDPLLSSSWVFTGFILSQRPWTEAILTFSRADAHKMPSWCWESVTWDTGQIRLDKVQESQVFLSVIPVFCYFFLILWGVLFFFSFSRMH